MKSCDKLVIMVVTDVKEFFVVIGFFLIYDQIRLDGRRMQRYFKIGLCVFIGCMILGGCGGPKLPTDFLESSLVIDKEGSVTEYLVSSFEKDFYDVAELERMVKQEAASFNGSLASESGKSPVQVLGVEKLAGMGNQVRVNRVFDKPDTYSKNSGEEFFYGTVASARAQLEKIGDSQQVKNSKGEPRDISQLLGMPERHMVLTKARMVIYCPFQVEFMSDNLSQREDGGVDTTGIADGEWGIIVLKK